MVDEQQADPDKSLKTPAPAPPGDDWGADWESAFQAEEFPADEADGDTALADGFQENVDDFAAADDDGRAEPLPGAGATGVAGAVGATAQPTLRPAWTGLAARLLARFTVLPLPVRLGIPATLVILLISFPLFRLLAPSPPPLDSARPPIEQAAAPTAIAVVPPAKPLPPEASPAAGVAPQAEPALPPATPQPEKPTITWPFTVFIIPVVDDETKATLFVNVELSLVLVLDDDKQGLPLTEKPFVRDTIYQFFVNRPLYDLRRYAMAKGEMSDQLIEWLRKQWPDGKVASLAIDNYTIN